MIDLSPTLCYIIFKAGQAPPVLLYDYYSTDGTAQCAQPFKKTASIIMCYSKERNMNSTCTGKARYIALYEKAWPWMHWQLWSQYFNLYFGSQIKESQGWTTCWDAAVSTDEARLCTMLWTALIRRLRDKNSLNYLRY